ncbi:unnamed protein product [Blepharisma stoltei]|uniref:Uncharacterized protein n=1 Tax=Blepharisma stoltei TaxID=1481888 RepID=A0AAU9I944_9CILI|nr:unnamed protein product [Blepharisma stoltei]
MSILNFSRQNLKELELEDEDAAYLNASNNLIASTWGIHLMVNLREVDFSYNLIRQIEGWGYLSQLEIIDMSHNCLASTFGLRSCIKVHTLLLRGNFLRGIEGLEGMKELKYLDVSHNQLNDVFASIRPLSLNAKLQSLFLEGNPLPAYRQYCYSMLQSLALLDGVPTPPSNANNKPGSLRSCYSIKKRPVQEKGSKVLTQRCRSAFSTSRNQEFYEPRHATSRKII